MAKGARYLDSEEARPHICPTGLWLESFLNGSRIASSCRGSRIAYRGQFRSRQQRSVGCGHTRRAFVYLPLTRLTHAECASPSRARPDLNEPPPDPANRRRFFRALTRSPHGLALLDRL